MKVNDEKNRIKVYDKNTKTYYDNKAPFTLRLYKYNDGELYFKITHRLPDGSKYDFDIPAHTIVDMMSSLIKKYKEN